VIGKYMLLLHGAETVSPRDGLTMFHGAPQY
jgi:hypothetical protein